MVSFAKITKMTVIIAFSQGVEGPKIEKNCFFRNDTKSLKSGSLGVFGPSDGFLGSLEQKKALLFVILATLGLCRQIRIKYEKKKISRQPKLA